MLGEKTWPYSLEPQQGQSRVVPGCGVELSNILPAIHLFNDNDSFAVSDLPAGPHFSDIQPLICLRAIYHPYCIMLFAIHAK